jgi:ketosteroid isomerase-like protein
LSAGEVMPSLYTIAERTCAPTVGHDAPGRSATRGGRARFGPARRSVLCFDSMRVDRPATTPVSSTTGQADSSARAATPQREAATGDTFTGAVREVSAGEASAPGVVAQRFYEALAAQDMEAVKQLYAPGATFRDPIFELKDGEAPAMWAGLFKSAKLERMTHEAPVVHGNQVKVAWHADYTVNGNKVHNDSVATLVIQGGKIVSHRDDWSWKAWARQALAPAPGWLLTVGRPLLNGIIRAGTL